MNLKIFKVEIYERALEPELSSSFIDLEKTENSENSFSD